MTDKWLYCLYCPLNGHCENQTRGIECATGLKELVKNFHILESRLDRAKRALCEVSQLSLQDNVDISRFYDIAHYTITELNKELK